MGDKIELTLAVGMKQAVDKQLNGQTRSEWIRGAIEDRLSGELVRLANLRYGSYRNHAAIKLNG